MQPCPQSACLGCTEPLVPYQVLCRPDVVAHTSNPSTWEVQTEGSEVHLNLQLHNQFRASLGYMRPVLNKQKSTLLIGKNNTLNHLAT